MFSKSLSSSRRLRLIEHPNLATKGLLIGCYGLCRPTQRGHRDARRLRNEQNAQCQNRFHKAAEGGYPKVSGNLRSRPITHHISAILAHAEHVLKSGGWVHSIKRLCKTVQ